MLRPIFRPPIQLLARRGRAVTSWPSSSRVAAVLLRRDVRRPYASEAVEVALGSLPIEKSAAPDPESQTDPSAPAEDFGGDDEVAPTTTLPPVQGQFYISSVFPIQLGKVDPRPLIASFRKNDLLEQFPSIASHVHIHSFKYLRTEKQVKDGGVFVTFSFVPPEEGEGPREKALQEIQEALFKAAEGQGGLKTWSYSGSAKIWRVLGRPWHEDMNKFPSSQVKVAFDGPDVHQEVLYDLLRPYGRIASLTPPTPQPPLTPRFALLQFTRLHSSTAAVAALHGLSVSPVPPEVITVHSASEAKAEPKPAPTPTLTRLSLSYQSPLQKHFFRDWISNHPKISLPALFFIIGTLSYTFFDPIRDFFITSKVLGRFNVEGYPIIKHVKALAATLLPHVFGEIASPAKPSQSALDPLKPSETETAAWREREEAEKLAEGWLRDYPSGFVLVSGPHGSGKNALVAKIVEQESKKALVIDCARIAKAKTEAGMVTELASQTGYWPFFGFLTSLNSLIDLAAMGLIGQKAGFSTDFPTQLKQILDIVSTSLKHVAEHELTGQARHAKSATDEALREAENLAFAERLKRVGYHDPRLDSIAGNGIMSELGYGDEIMTANDLAQPTDEVYLDAEQPSSEPGVLSGVTGDGPASDSVYLDEERDAISALPVVVLRDFALKGSKKDELWSTIAEWAAGLIENRIAQVVVVCDNSSASKPLARALPSKPLNSIALADADSKAALSFVAEKLGDSHPEMTEKDKSLVSIFGGRMNDLEGLIFKVRTGQTIADAVDDILTRTQIELRKSVFGDDTEEAKNLPWTRPQAWKIVSSLAKRGEVSYSALLLGFPFKGNEDKLKALEAAEFISVTYVNGRPSVVKAGKPLYLATFKKLVEDPVFHASQTLASDAEVISSAEATIKACETELLSLKEVGFESGKGWPVISGSGPIEIRARYLMDKMKAAQISINSLETEAAEFKTVLTTST